MNRNFENRKSRKLCIKSNENKAIIKALDMYGRVPEQWELLEEIERLQNIIKEVREYITTHKLYNFKYDEEELFEITTDKKAKDELLEILDKVD